MSGYATYQTKRKGTLTRNLTYIHNFSECV
jgi:hypothetical protein